MRTLRLALLLVLVAPRLLLAVTSTPSVPQTPKLSHVALSTSQAMIFTCNASGSMVTGIFATSTDASARDVTLYVKNTTSYILAVVTIPANSGNANGTPAVNLMAAATFPGLPLTSDGNPFFYCASGDTVEAKVSSGTSVNLFIIGADF